MIPSDPPEPQFSWPRHWWMWLMDHLLWCKQTQAVPDQDDFDVKETPNGRLFCLKENPESLLTGSAESTYTLEGGEDNSDGAELTPFEDYWDLTEEGKGKDVDDNDLAPDYDSVLWRGPRITRRIISRAYTFDLGSSDVGNPGEIDFIMREYSLFSRDVTLNSIGEIIKISVETQRQIWRAWDYDGVLP